MALSKVTYVDGVTIIGAKNLNDIQDELIRQGEQQAEDEAELALKANTEDVQTALALKADKSDTYTKAEVNEALGLKANTADVNEALALKADKTETYTKAQVDSIVEDAIAEAVKESEYSNFEMKSVSGDLIHITDGAGLIPVKNLKIGIEAVQEGTGDPSPENIRPISGWTGAKVKRTGKNLWDNDFFATQTDPLPLNTNPTSPYYGMYGGTSFKKWANHYSPSGSGMGSVFGFPINFGQLTVSFNHISSGSNGILRVYFLYDDGTSAYDGNISVTSTLTRSSRTSNSSKNCVGAFIQTSSGELATGYYIGDVQFEIGAVATDYEYGSNTYPITWEDEAGTVYGGTLDVTSGELVVTHKMIDLGDLTYIVYNQSVGFFRGAGLSNAVAGLQDNICTDYVCKSTYADVNATDGTFGIVNVGGIYMWIHDSNYAQTDATTFKTAMVGKKVVHTLATPQTYQLTPTEVLTLLGENNIFADTGAVEELIYRISRQ